MAQDYALYEKQGPIVTITFNRPEKLNCAISAHWKEVTRRVIQAEEDPQVKVIVFRGAGRCFGSGHDVVDLGPHHGWGEDERRPSQRRRLQWDFLMAVKGQRRRVAGSRCAVGVVMLTSAPQPGRLVPGGWL